jgi:hypothetical protein
MPVLFWTCSVSSFYHLDIHLIHIQQNLEKKWSDIHQGSWVFFGIDPTLVGTLKPLAIPGRFTS